jgi:hypothetical protein
VEFIKKSVCRKLGLKQGKMTRDEAELDFFHPDLGGMHVSAAVIEESRGESMRQCY